MYLTLKEYFLNKRVSILNHISFIYYFTHFKIQMLTASMLDDLLNQEWVFANIFSFQNITSQVI